MIGRITRLISIAKVLIGYHFDDWLLLHPNFSSKRWLLWLLAWQWFRPRPAIEDRARLCREALEKLGPVFIKFGQILSTRADLLSPTLVEELSKLQDRVPPFDGDLARETIEQALHQPIEDLFAAFDQEPLAAASIAQVHCATLHDGQEVVVKVLRPNIRQQIERDLSWMEMLAQGLSKITSFQKRFKPTEIVEDYRFTLLGELDLQLEAANASLLRKNFSESVDLYVPLVHWDFCSTQTLVLEKIHGIPVNDVESLKQHGINLMALAEKGMTIFFTQVFDHNFFHADMHPGNIVVDPDCKDNPRYMCVDFGIVGSLNRRDQRYLAENFHAFFNRNYAEVARLHIRSGWVPPDTSERAFENAIRSVCEPIFEKPLGEISYGRLLMKLFATAQQFNMPVQPQLVLLQKTLLNVEGLGRQIYPELDLWKIGKPFFENWTKEQVGLKALIKNAEEELPTLLENLPKGPNVLFDFLQTQVREQPVQTEPTKTGRHTWLLAAAGAIIIAILPMDLLHQLTWWQWSAVIIGGYCLWRGLR